MRHARDFHVVRVDDAPPGRAPGEDRFLVRQAGRKRRRFLAFQRGGSMEELEESSLPPEPALPSIAGSSRDADVEADTRTPPVTVYRHIFGIQNLADLPGEDALAALAAGMAELPGSDEDGTAPAGYTYLGQFIIHDLTALGTGPSPDRLPNARSPSLDLDSVLPGDRPDGELAGADGLFAIGTTSGDAELDEDLPRCPFGEAFQGRARIADARNDEFLPLAQIHMLLLKFYNRIARDAGYSGAAMNDEWWAGVKTKWVQHFQSIVLDDYLPKIADPDVYADVRESGRRRIVCPEDATKAVDWLPLEFAGAIGRFGHSMIRDSYQPWNRQISDAATVRHFMKFTYPNSGDGLLSEFRKLPLKWVSNWLNLFDFADTEYEGDIPQPIKAALIDRKLAPPLSKLPTCLRDEMCYGDMYESPGFDLAAQTLRRGRELHLATGQQAVAFVKARVPIEELTEDELFPPGEMADLGGHLQTLKQRTPLWYYILREAELLGGGNHLGPLGSRVLVETMHAAIEASEVSILRIENWQADLPGAKSGRFTMPALILYCAKPDPSS